MSLCLVAECVRPLTTHGSDINKIEAGKLLVESLPFRVQELLLDARVYRASALAKGVDFVQADPPTYERPLLGDLMRVRQIIANLLGNAIKFSNKGDAVTFEVSVTEHDDNIARVHIRVRDTGIGIEPAMIPKLFEPFQQADSSTARKYGGTGLGLTLVQSLVREMRGNIHVESEVDKGTLVEVSLPFKRAPDELMGFADATAQDTAPVDNAMDTVRDVVRHAGVPRTHARSRESSADSITVAKMTAKPSSGARAEILLAEDNEIVSSVLRKMLEQLGFACTRVADGEQAVDEALRLSNDAQRRRRYALILMDVQMPIMDGKQATTLIRERESAERPTPPSPIPIVALTASAISGDREACIESGMSDYLAKPVSMKQLKRAIMRNLPEGFARPFTSPSPSATPVSAH